ncbi:MAG: hypothetical protein KJ900_14595 [Proteobacteria bacterium]|jgi:hypothetical protein|nr:hypothetical protein [Desulfocapsa sp.]MBU3946106.1 hypothetical protein [Pseudomonadota bacterium]MCG2745726.1 hypothetical protein [Desulfobacteraceae bacterium]MBU4028347.1 hypothetical protein [Pseudomonadota bacterium]MBU4044102.1 hypothetical protein [Pseudomonadota bacterium]
MKKKLLQLISALIFLVLAVGAQALEHGAMAGMDHSGMDMGGGEIMLPEVTVDGVKAMAHLLDTSKAMAAAGMSTTNHLMITFTDIATGKALDSGVVAVKVVDPAGKKTEAVQMMSMGESFGVDVALSKKGKYVFEVGTKLGNGEKRQFLFDYMVK